MSNNQDATTSFVVKAINGLSESDFKKLVYLFQETYWGYEAVIDVDGPGDGGCDIKVFKNKKEQKKCVQVTVQKTLVHKIKADLEKTERLVKDYDYSPSLEFYCSICVPNAKIEEYKRTAKTVYGIELDLYDATRIAGLGGRAVEEFIYGIHTDVVIRSGEDQIGKANRYLYDLLANGSDSSDIKNCIVESVIISIIYEKGTIDIGSLKRALEQRLGKCLPDITHLINLLKSDKRVINVPGSSGTIRLSEEEERIVKDIFASSIENEKAFDSALNALVAKYQIKEKSSVVSLLKKLYERNYYHEINEENADVDNVTKSSFDDFKCEICKLLPDAKKIDLFVVDLKQLCDSNNHINRITAGEAFVNLYKSNKLEQYLSKKDKTIFLDTPAFIYYLCSIYDTDLNLEDWDDPFYRSMKSLKRIQIANSNKIKFHIMEDYLYEVANEIKKALQISQFETYPFFSDLGKTRNTIYNYYAYLRDNDLFEISDKIESIEDFLRALGFENTDYSDDYFINNTLRALHELAENLNIDIEQRPSCDSFNDFIDAYRRKLYTLDKEKSEYAIKNDVNQIIVALEYSKWGDRYVTTWDTTLHYIRDNILNKDSKNRYSFFSICNPARLSNRLALESFNIDSSALTNDIFAYADRKYDISKKVKSLLELIAPYTRNGNINDKLLIRLAQIRKEQCEKSNISDKQMSEETVLPVEEALALILPSAQLVQEDHKIEDKFIIYMSSEDNSDYILDTLKGIMEEQDYNKYDLSPFWERVKQVELS